MSASSTVTRVATGTYVFLFFALLFAPLIIMSITAFNSSSFPRIFPWDCLTFEWFARLANESRVKTGLYYSMIVGALVVALSLLLGLAGALLLTQIYPRARTTYYTVVTSPILMPGIVIGIATVLFWDKIARFFGFTYGTFLYNGIFLTVLGQSSFIASYCMLVFVARLQRFDQAQMEAALDLGATHVQAFRKILLPFLKPAIFSAAVIAFLASFENYNTSVFTLGHYSTFTVVIAQKVRLGLDPTISALAVIIITLTLFLALLNEAWSRHAERNPGSKSLLVKGAFTGFFVNNPAAILSLIALAGIASVIAYAISHDPAECKAEVQKRRLEIQQRYNPPKAPATPTAPAQTAPTPAQPAQPAADAPFGGVFNPNNLSTQPTPPQPAPAQPAPAQPSPFGGVFQPQNLAPVQPPAPAPAPAQSSPFGGVLQPQNLTPAAPSATPPAPASPPAEAPFGGVFNPGNLKPETSPP